MVTPLGFHVWAGFCVSSQVSVRGVGSPLLEGLSTAQRRTHRHLIWLLVAPKNCIRVLPTTQRTQVLQRGLARLLDLCEELEQSAGVAEVL